MKRAYYVIIITWLILFILTCVACSKIRDRGSVKNGDFNAAIAENNSDERSFVDLDPKYEMEPESEHGQDTGSMSKSDLKPVPEPNTVLEPKPECIDLFDLETQATRDARALKLFINEMDIYKQYLGKSIQELFEYETSLEFPENDWSYVKYNDGSEILFGDELTFVLFSDRFWLGSSKTVALGICWSILPAHDMSCFFVITTFLGF